MGELKRLIKEVKKKEHTIPIGDFHSVNTTAIYGDEYIRLLKEDPVKANKLRKKGKTNGLAILYGSSAYGLAKDSDITEEEAESIINNFYKGVPKLKQLHEYQKNNAKSNGITNNIFGGIRYLPFANKNISEKEKKDPQLRKMFFSKRSKMMRLAMNNPIQSASALQLILILIKVNKFIEENRLNRVYGNLINEYRPYTRVIAIHKNKISDSVEEELDKLPDGSHKIIVIDDNRDVVGEFDRLVTINKDTINKFDLEIIF